MITAKTERRIFLESTVNLTKESKKKRRQAVLKKMSRYKFLYFLILPAIVYTVIFNYLTMGGIIMAFQDYDIIGGIFKSPFVGLSNFVQVFSQPKMLHAIKNTLVYSSVGLFLGTPGPIIFALLLNELRTPKFKKVVQTISYFPHFLSWISVVGMLSAFFATYGTWNDILAKIFGEGYERVNILMDAKNFLPVLFWSGQWKGIGWGSIVYLAAITGIDQTLYEAATVDGCGKFKQALYITIPSIMPTIIMLFIMSMGGLFSTNFEQVFGFQNIYTQEATETINTLIYRTGIQNGEYSLSTAFGLSQSAVSFLLVWISNRIIKKGTGVGIW
jgi:putative aldouronate transport system permease protein